MRLLLQETATLETAPDRCAADYPDGSQADDDGADSKGAVCKHGSHFG
jgi:hypothetical protein